MDNKLLGNFIIAFPTAAYVTYSFAMKEPHSGFDLMQAVITGLIAMVSYGIGNRIKNKGKAE